MDIVSRVRSLNLPLGQYVVFGSGVMEVHGIRKARDVDVVVTETLYKKLKEMGWKRRWFFKRVLICKALTSNGNEAFTSLSWKAYRVSTDELIRDAELIDGIPFMSISNYLHYKRHLPREKDVRDVFLIEEYLKNTISSPN